MLPDMDPEAGAVVELLWALLAGEAPLSGVEGVAMRLQVRLEGEAPHAEAALVSLRATDRLGVLRVLAAFRTLWCLIERCIVSDKYLQSKRQDSVQGDPEDHGPRLG